MNKIITIISFLIWVSTNTCALAAGECNAEFAFGVIADCQYCAVEGTGVRKYSLSKEKLEMCVADFNTMDLEFVIHLGDLIDRDYKNFDVVLPIYNQLNMPKYHVLGNHDFSVADDLKKDVPKALGLTSKYYTFSVKGWRCVVLDGNDISFYAYPMNSEEYANTTEYYQRNSIKSPKWNGAIGKKQLSWLRGVLEEATRNNENVLLFCHFPVYPKAVHNLWNDDEVVTMLEEFPCVKAYINGHNHAGEYEIREGIHYLTLKGMLDTEQNSYAVIRIDEDHIQVDGYGREPNRMMKIRK